MSKRRFGDRKDGIRVRKIDSMFVLIPQVMRTRLDSQVHFEEEIALDAMEKFIREHKEDMPSLTTMHIVAAALVRMMALRPCVNRFVVHNKLYAHTDIRISIAVKRGITEESEEATIKPLFKPTDTIYDVVRSMDAEMAAIEGEGSENDTDVAARILGKLPTWLLRFVVRLLFFMDNHGCLPKFLTDLSPWHTSAWITNVGSIGLSPVYHHLYEFGTASFFLSMGKKRNMPASDFTGEIQTKRKMGIRAVVDERVCDGYYYATALRSFTKYLTHPELLMEPPKEVKRDPGVDWSRYE